ncbi:MAG: tRNA threonylcarbamoyladenosine dehydratase, partial [Desulfobacteraceae bacterium]|nr:tRNA threonylcarbamoyladenosine dehydratase [Desulfobacteraceae bacterium]
KTDASMIKISDLFETSVCPLARFVRRRLRRRGISEDVKCVYSEEPPKGNTKETKINPELELRLEQSLNPESDIEPDYGRKRSSLGTVSYVTGTFGLMIANLVIDTILN